MSFSNQQIPAMSNVLDETESSILQPSVAVFPALNRRFLGIPAESDDFSRGLIFLFDPSTGQPSVHSPREGSVDGGGSPAYQHSQSSNNTSSHKVFTPQSTSGSTDGPHPRVVSPRSGRSSESESHDRDAIRQQRPSVSARASAGASEAVLSPALSQASVHMPMTAESPPATMSPDVDLSMSEPFDPIEDMKDPRDIINIGPSEVQDLEEIMQSGILGGLGHRAQMLYEMPLANAQINDSMALHHSQLVQGLQPTSREAVQRTEYHRRRLAIRSKRASRSRESRGMTKDAREKAREIRRIGSCLPCLVNHEQVSI